AAATDRGASAQLLLRAARAHLGVPGPRVADPDVADHRHEVAEQLLVDVGARDDTRGRGAVLARVEIAADLDPLHDLLQIRVVEYDDRRLATELQVDAFQGRGCVARDLFARGRS